MELWNASPLGHQVIKGRPLCNLHRPAGFGKAAGECSGQGMLASFGKALGSWFCLSVPVDFINAGRVGFVNACELALGWMWVHTWHS